MQMHYQLIDPFTDEEIKTANWKEAETRALDLIKRVYDENAKRGKVGNDRFICCGIMRANPDRHTWFNLTTDDPSRGLRLKNLREQYCGAQGHAEQLLNGKWRLATHEEEIACRNKDKAASEKKIAERKKKAAAAATETLRGIIEAANK